MNVNVGVTIYSCGGCDNVLMWKGKGSFSKTLAYMCILV